MALSTREAVKSVYPYPRWMAKVDKMSEAQVWALYLRFKKESKL